MFFQFFLPAHSLTLSLTNELTFNMPLLSI